MRIPDILRSIGLFERERVIGEITVYLPEPQKDYKKIANWDLKKSEQKFQYTVQPEKNRDPSEAFLKQEFLRFQNGYWFFNNGSLEWITPFHYFFLNYWTDKGKRMKFVDAQRDAGLWLWQIETLDNMMGGNLVSNRRFGKTVWATAWAYFRASTNKFHRCGIQSKTNADGKLVFNKLIKSWQKLPDWLKPVDSGETRPATILEFSEPRVRSSKTVKKVYGDVLDSSIDFRSSEEDAYDGDELHTYIEDEFGKCHTKGTQILMYDSSYKNVEDIEVGDLLMGDDSNPRLVKSLARGNQKCYMVKPIANGWYEWGCNENHILSVIYSNKNRQSRFKNGQVYNISIKEFLKLTKTDQRHFCLYRKPIDYKSKPISIDPYILGTWLGDGTSRGTHITTQDNEIAAAWAFYAKSIDHEFKVADQRENYATYKIVGLLSTKGKSKNKFLTKLQSYNLISNKHIPNDYLINDRQSRLKLLAGLIDTDGSTGKYKNYYEITQKNKTLAYDIRRLASELGYKSNIKSKNATMKRADGSYYECEVYRVHISGLNLYEIPCLIEKKKIAKKEFIHKNTKDSLKTCFKLEDIGNQDYFGFMIDNNSLYMLKDCTITHNCINVNTDTRWGVVQYCLVIGAEIVGKALRTTTVEEMERRGGKNAKKTWDDSLMSTLNPVTNRTNSMLTNLFIPADFGFAGFHPKTKQPFVDEYGISNRELAREYILSTWENLSDEKLKAAQRKNPLTIKHAFQLANNTGSFDPEIYEYLDQQKEYLEGTSITGERAPKNLRRRVTFYRDDQGLARWKDDEFGHSSIVWDFPEPKFTNARKMGDLARWVPMNAESFAAGVDPFAATIVTGAGSMGVLYIYRKGDPNDPENSGLFVCRYAQRTRLKADFHKMVMIICQYYGCKANYESDVDDYYETFLQEGYKNYIMWRPKCTIDPTRRNVTIKYGTPSKDAFALQKHYQITVEYLLSRWHKIYFIELIDQYIAYDHEDRTKSDEVIAAGMALIGGFEGGTARAKDTRAPLFVKFKEQQREVRNQRIAFNKKFKLN